MVVLAATAAKLLGAPSVVAGVIGVVGIAAVVGVMVTGLRNRGRETPLAP